MTKGTKKAPKVTYLEPPKEVKTVPLNYDPQTKVHDAFEDDLDFLLNDVAKPGQPMIERPPDEPKTNQKKKKDKKVIKKERMQSVNLTKESRREILDFDIHFSSDDEQGQPEKSKADGKKQDELMNRFMENQLGIVSSEYQYQEIDSRDIESIDDYLQMLDSSDDNLSDEALDVANDEERETRLGQELSMRKLRQNFEQLQLQRGAKGQKKTYSSFIDHAPGSNWNRLKQRLAIGKRTDVSEKIGECQIQARASTHAPQDRAVKNVFYDKNEKPKSAEDKKSMPKRDKQLNFKHETTKNGSIARPQKKDKLMKPIQKPLNTEKNGESQHTQKKPSSDQKGCSEKKSLPQSSCPKTTKKKKNFKHPTKLIPKVPTA